MVKGTPSTFSQISSTQRRTLLAAALGWMLDAFDTMLYALVLAHVMRDLGMSKGTAGLLNSLTLLASGIGGVDLSRIAWAGNEPLCSASLRTRFVHLRLVSRLPF